MQIPYEVFQKVKELANTPEDVLLLLPPLERATVMAIKEMIQKKSRR